MIGARFEDASTWHAVLVRCPKCSKTIVPEGIAEHQEWHLRWQIGEYMDSSRNLVSRRKDAVAMYVGNGRAMFFIENEMRWVGLTRDRP